MIIDDSFDDTLAAVEVTCPVFQDNYADAAQHLDAATAARAITGVHADSTRIRGELR